VLSGKVSKFSITFTLDISPDYAPYSISRVLRDRRQSKSKKSDQPRISAVGPTSKNRNSQTAYLIEAC
jgi:hypothetical protein